MMTDLSIYPAPEREQRIMTRVQQEGPALQRVFYEMIIERPGTPYELSREERREVWPSIFRCLYECVYRAIEAKGWKIPPRAWPLLCSAGFFLAVNNLLGYDFLTQSNPVSIYTLNGINTGEKADYLMILLSQAYYGIFSPKTLYHAIYEVFELTGWKGCPVIEQQGMRRNALQDLRSEAERYRVEGRANRMAAMERNAAAGRERRARNAAADQEQREWNALRSIRMGGTRRTVRKSWTFRKSPQNTAKSRIAAISGGSPQNTHFVGRSPQNTAKSRIATISGGSPQNTHFVGRSPQKRNKQSKRNKKRSV